MVERVVFLGRSVICADEGAWCRSRVTSLKGGKQRWLSAETEDKQEENGESFLSLCLNLNGETGAHPNHTQPHQQENAPLLRAHNILSSQGSVYLVLHDEFIGDGPVIGQRPLSPHGNLIAIFSTFKSSRPGRVAVKSVQFFTRPNEEPTHCPSVTPS